ncbi:MAG: hypothetical protein KAT75_10795 [Dehalococcoidia bacterium]|nr:hypothetical protein [Dehalococcoidia bacterium]
MQNTRLFGTSGIRGVVNQDLTPELCQAVGQAIGATLPTHSRVCIATDTRVSREMVKNAVTLSLLSSGVDVTSFGILPTPALALLTREMGFDTGIMITASHNPPEYNGIKLFNENSIGYSRAQEAEIEELIKRRTLKISFPGTLSPGQQLKETYFQFIQDRFSGKSFDRHMKIVVDPGNGAAAGFTSELFSTMGFKVMPVNDEPDGLFRGRNSEPGEDTLQGTVKFLKKEKADLAVCFDGDAERVVFCDREGFLGFNEMVAYISRIVAMETGRKKIATTVEMGRLLDLSVADLGVEVVRGMVGDTDVAYLARELDAAIGVEGVGVYIIPEVGYYPDSIFATLILLSHLNDTREIRGFFDGIPRLFFEKSKVHCPNGLKEDVMVEIRKRVHLFEASEMNILDGLRLEYDDAWMLIRASGTEPAIRVIAEAPSRSRTVELLAEGAEAVHTCLARCEL